MALGLLIRVIENYAAMSRPSPCVDLSITGVMSPIITVERIVDGEVSVLRGAKNVQTTGNTMFFTDYEVPFSVTVTYRVYTSATPNGARTDQVENITIVNSSDCWISDPLVPSFSTPVLLSIDGLNERSYKSSGNVYAVEGNRLPIGVYGKRSAAQNVPMKIICRTLNERDRVLEVLENASPVLLRSPLRLSFVPLGYFVAPEISVSHIDTALEAGETSHITMSITLVRPPSANIVAPSRTYENILAENSTYTDLIQRRFAYLSALRGY